MATIGVEPKRLRIASLTLSPRSKPSNKSATKNKKPATKEYVQFIGFALVTITLHMATIVMSSVPRATAAKCFKQFVNLGVRDSKKLDAPYRSRESKT